MSIRRFSTNWNKEKVTELAMLSGHGDLANEGNKKSQRLIKELKEYLLTDNTNNSIAFHNDISISQLEKDIQYWKKTYKQVKDKSLLLQDEKIKYSNIEGGIFFATIPDIDETIPIHLHTEFNSLDEIRLDVRRQICNKLGVKFSDLNKINFSLCIKWDVEINPSDD